MAGRGPVDSEREASGVRIAEAVLGASPTCEVIDVGALEHPVREPWPADGVSLKGLRAAVGGPAGGLAQAYLDRGYRVEQELATVAAVRQALAL